MFILFHWAETKRAYDLKYPGSQGDGSFFGITDDFKGKEPGYPGEKYKEAFDLEVKGWFHSPHIPYRRPLL